MMRCAIHLKGHGKMMGTKIPNSLRLERAESWAVGSDNAGKYTAVVAGFIAATAFSSAEAQQSAPLPPVNVDVPTTRAKPAASKPSPDALRARTALRRAARRAQPTTAAPAVPYPNAGGLQAPNQNPYADAAAPYKVDRLQASGKFPEPLLNTPKTVTVLTKELLADENATSLKQAVLSTAGVTLGTGEGGNAFGDRFFIRGFDARNDVFVDGVRDAGVSVRENFFTEQVEILRGPASSYAGRGTAGGAINIVTKQARTDRSFYGMDTTIGTDSTRRVVIDANQVITPSLAVRAGGLFQEAGVAGRDLTTDNRNGGYVATKWTPLDTVKITTGYVHTGISGLPDFGVPYYRPNAASPAGTGGPFPDFGVNRRNFYGFVNRDFYRVAQDVGSLNAEVNITPDLTLTNKVRVQRSSNDYIGTLAERPVNKTPLELSTLTANPQSRYQVTDMAANQTEATYKFDTYNWKHTLLGGVEISRERTSIDAYTGLAIETLDGVPIGNSVPGVSVFNPQFANLPSGAISLVGRPTKVKIDTNSVYVMDSANWQDVVILNGGVRYDDYTVNANGFATVNNVPKPVASSVHSGMPNFNVGAVYKPVPIGSLYVAYATSSNPVGSEFDGTSPAYNGGLSLTGATSAAALGPEKNTSVEVGTKWELFDRHMLVTGALFQTTKDNARETVSGIVQAGAAYRIRGIDLGVGGKVTDKLSIFGGLVLMQSEATKSLATPSNTALFGTSNVGLKLANIAHESFNMLAKYQLTDVWEIGGSATYKSKIFGGSLVANVGTELPSYWRFDTFVEAKINKNWSAKLFVNNIFDKRYYDAMYQSGTPFVLEAPGRSASFVVSGRF
jgi:catecholate siderophore receptor